MKSVRSFKSFRSKASFKSTAAVGGQDVECRCYHVAEGALGGVEGLAEAECVCVCDGGGATYSRGLPA